MLSVMFIMYNFFSDVNWESYEIKSKVLFTLRMSEPASN